MKILLISGFLGAGKTTFISEMAKATKKKFVIVENEFGNVNIDKDILKQDNEEMKVWELTEGCICCSLNLDFTHSVLTIANTLDPDYLVVEPSGVALPSNILEQLNKICYERIELLSPITIVDALNYHDSKVDFPEYFYNQIDNSKYIVLSKSENLTSNEIENLTNDLHIKDKIISFEHYTKWDENTWNKIFENGEENSKVTSISVDKKLENISFNEIENLTVDKLIVILDLFNSGCLGKIVRAKGCFKTNDEWIRFDLVNKLYAITGSNEIEENKIVVIGENLNKSAIKYLFTNKKEIKKFKFKKNSTY